MEESCTSPEKITIIYFIPWKGMTLRVENYQIMVRKDHPLHLTVPLDLAQRLGHLHCVQRRYSLCPRDELPPCAMCPLYYEQIRSQQ